tara:strand:+ start:930 stop:2270 length:1341 start_codon:yes stop_codon:yes gene_type:complete
MTGGATYQFLTRVGSNYTSIGTLVASTTNTFEYTAPSGAYSGYLYLYQVGAGTGSILIDASSIPNELVAAGCVSDYDLAYANPTQSNIVRNRSDAGDGTAAGGVVQITAIDQLNSKSARIGTSAATPAEGELLVSGNAGIGGTAVTKSSSFGDATTLGIVGTDGSGNGPTIQMALDTAFDARPQSLLFFNRNNADVSGPTVKSIAGIRSFTANAGGGTDGGGNLKFYTKPEAGAFTDRLTIDSTGNVNIGPGAATFAAGGGLRVEAATFASVRVCETGNTGVDLSQDSSANGYVFNRDNADLILGTNGTQYLRIASSGLSTFSGGIKSENGIYGGQMSAMADDAIDSITPPRQGVMMAISYSNDNAYPAHSTGVGLLYCDTGSSLNIAKMTPTSSTSIVVGTTAWTANGGANEGTDNRLNIAVVAGSIQIKNRLGVTVTPWYNFIN